VVIEGASALRSKPKIALAAIQAFREFRMRFVRRTQGERGILTQRDPSSLAVSLVAEHKGFGPGGEDAHGESTPTAIDHIVAVGSRFQGGDIPIGEGFGAVHG
jgi:hypothetical protein